MQLTRLFKVVFMKRLIIIVSIVCLVLFYFFSREVKRGFLHQADFNTTVRIQDEIDRSTRLRLAALINNVFEGSTVSASPQVSAAFVGLLTIAALYDWKKKQIRWRALAIPVFFALLTLGEVYGKSVVTHPAPPFFMIKHPTTIFPQFYINEQYSYPSGHTARATFVGIVFLPVVAGYISRTRKNLKKWFTLAGIVCLYVLVVATGKIYLGEHWLSDIIGGGLLGTSLGLIAVAFR